MYLTLMEHVTCGGKIVNINFLHDNLSAIRENGPGKEPTFMGVSRGGGRGSRPPLGNNKSYRF